MEKSKVVPAEVGDIFSMYGEQFHKQYKMPAQHLRAMNAIRRCRTRAMGSHSDKCDTCGHINIHHNSCRNRHCPKCQGLNQIKWADKLAATLLPVKYFHIIFTIPEELNRLTLVNQECMYNILFKAASDTILMLAKDKKYIGVDTGLVAVLHTWGQNLMDHPHLHTMVPAGGLDPLSQYWKHSPKNFFIPVKVLSEVFRGKFLAMLKKAYKNKQLKFAGEIAPLQQARNFRKLLDIVYQKEWNVNSRRSSSKMSGVQIIKYLARYSHRVAISNDRILGIEDDQVVFKWKDNKDKGKQKVMKLDAVEFIRRYMLHILPDGFCKIRYFGIFALRNRKTLLIKIKKDLGRKAVKAKYTGLPWNEVLLLLTGIDPLQCPKCKAGRMIQFEGTTALQARMTPT